MIVKRQTEWKQSNENAVSLTILNLIYIEIKRYTTLRSVRIAKM